MSPVLHVQQLVCMQYNLTLYGHIKTAEQRTIIQQYGQAHREGGVAGASAPGPGGPKGALRPLSKNLSWCEKR